MDVCPQLFSSFDKTEEVKIVSKAFWARKKNKDKALNHDQLIMLTVT